MPLVSDSELKVYCAGRQAGSARTMMEKAMLDLRDSREAERAAKARLADADAQFDAVTERVTRLDDELLETRARVNQLENVCDTLRKDGRDKDKALAEAVDLLSKTHEHVGIYDPHKPKIYESILQFLKRNGS
jgi:septal ring factor EnvC (AmiA/AmiB activator)